MKDENFNDNQMQDENNRHEIIQKIKESADKEKIPESLNPENLDRLLEQGKTRRAETGNGEMPPRTLRSVTGRLPGWPQPA